MAFTIHGKCSSYNVKEKHGNQTVHSVNFNYLRIRTVCNTEALTFAKSKCLQQGSPLCCLPAVEHSEAKGKGGALSKSPLRQSFRTYCSGGVRGEGGVDPKRKQYAQHPATYLITSDGCLQGKGESKTEERADSFY